VLDAGRLDAASRDAGVADASRSGYAPEELGGETEHCPKTAPDGALTCTASSSRKTVDVRFLILPDRTGFRARVRVPALGLDISVYRGVTEACAECQAEVDGDTLRFVCREDLTTLSGEVRFDANALQVSWGPDRLFDAADCHHETRPLPCAARVRLHGTTMHNTCEGPAGRAGQSL
jgi:hypothetical protein